MKRVFCGFGGYVTLLHRSADVEIIQYEKDGTIRATFDNSEYFEALQFEDLLMSAGLHSFTSFGGQNIVVWSISLL